MEEISSEMTSALDLQAKSSPFLFKDVDRAVNAAERAFKHGEWGRMNARDRGTLINRLADLMDEHKEELATIESIDSGAVYTLALKTHVGMSIDTWRYFAGTRTELCWS